MKPGSLQQALTGLAVALAVTATLLGGVILALSDTARGPGRLADQPAPTTFRIPTLPPLTVTGPVIFTPTNVTSTDATSEDDTATNGAPADRTIKPTVAVVPTDTRRPTATDTPRPSATPTGSPTSTPAPVRTRVPTTTPIVNATGTQTATDGACTNANSIITTPSVGALLSGEVTFYGTAQIPNFSFYKLEIRREGESAADGYITFHTGLSPVVNGPLATLDTDAWASGEYWVRLVVIDSTSNYPERCAILYLFD